MLYPQVQERFKARHDCTDYAFYMLNTPSPAHTDAVRNLALHCLEMTVNKRWSDFDAATKRRYAMSMLAVLQQGTRHLLSEANFIKQKVRSVYFTRNAIRSHPNCCYYCAGGYADGDHHRA